MNTDILTFLPCNGYLAMNVPYMNAATVHDADAKVTCCLPRVEYSLSCNVITCCHQHKQLLCDIVMCLYSFE